MGFRLSAVCSPGETPRVQESWTNRPPNKHAALVSLAPETRRGCGASCSGADRAHRRVEVSVGLNARRAVCPVAWDDVFKERHMLQYAMKGVRVALWLVHTVFSVCNTGVVLKENIPAGELLVSLWANYSRFPYGRYSHKARLGSPFCKSLCLPSAPVLTWTADPCQPSAELPGQGNSIYTKSAQFTFRFSSSASSSIYIHSDEGDAGGFQGGGRELSHW